MRNTTGSPPPAPDADRRRRKQIRALAADLPAVWDAPITTDADRKPLFGHLVDRVHIIVAGASEKVDVEIVRAGVHSSSAQIIRPVACLTKLSYNPQFAARARELAAADAPLRSRAVAQRRGFRELVTAVAAAGSIW